MSFAIDFVATGVALKRLCQLFCLDSMIPILKMRNYNWLRKLRIWGWSLTPVWALNTIEFVVSPCSNSGADVSSHGLSCGWRISS